MFRGLPNPSNWIWEKLSPFSSSVWKVKSVLEALITWSSSNAVERAFAQSCPAGGAITVLVIFTQLVSCTFCMARSCILRTSWRVLSRRAIASSVSLPRKRGAAVTASTPITNMVIISSTSVKPFFFTLLDASFNVNRGSLTNSRRSCVGDSTIWVCFSRSCSVASVTFIIN